MKAPCGPGTNSNRVVGWAVQWGDGFTGNRVLSRGSNPAAYFNVGTASDNAVHHSDANSGLGDCGTATSGPASGTWGPISHAYSRSGTYTACVVLYDVHYKNAKLTSLAAALTAVQTNVTVVDASAISTGEVLLVDQEQMLVSAKSGKTLTVTRGVDGTTAAAHKKGATVSGIVLTDPKQIVAGSNAVKYSASNHNADNSAESNAASSGVAQCLPTTVTVGAQLSIAKTDNRGGSSITGAVGTAVPGNSITYTIVVNNSGPSAATGVAVNDPLPAALQNASWTGTNGSSGTGGVSDTIASLPAGGSVTYTLTATIDPAATGTLSNVATASSAVDPGGPRVATDTDFLTPLAVLSVEKTVDGVKSEVANVDDTVSFSVVLDNQGPSDATGTAVNDLLPAGLAFVNATPSVGSYDANTGIWTIGTLGAGNQASLTIDATVTTIGNTVPSSITNTATASADEAATVNSSASVNVNAALFLTKQASLGDSFDPNNTTHTAKVDDDLTYQLTIANTGGNTANNVVVTDVLPANFSLTTGSITPSVGSISINSGVLTWTIPSLAAAANATLIYTETVGGAGTNENNASASSNETNQYGSSPSLSQLTDSWTITVAN
jgi:uncharacterized repeat protein (TIGR01451 family)